jgi:hypothetical protein
MMNIPPVETSNVLVCPVAVVPSSTGCASNEVCAVAAASPARTCIYQAGATSCPGTYPTSTSVGTAPTDTRMCTGSCECSAAASCTPTSWTFFQKGGCDASGGSVSINVDGNCHSTGAVGGSSYGSYSYEATTQVACSASGGSAMASGSVGVTGESTVCCM